MPTDDDSPNDELSLGHVALVSELLAELATSKPKLKVGVIVIFIANEENSSIEGVGVDEMEKHGLLAQCKNGPLYWVDCADSQPCIGTGGVQVAFVCVILYVVWFFLVSCFSSI